MAAVTSTVATYSIVPASEVVEVLLQTRDDVDATDTFTVTLATVGIAPTGLLSVQGFVHTTSGSIITREAVTTSVAAGVLTVTIPAGTDNDVRIVKLTGLSSAPTYAA